MILHTKYEMPLAQIQQDIWRQKQLRMLYITGRPIYGVLEKDKFDNLFTKYNRIHLSSANIAPNLHLHPMRL